MSSYISISSEKLSRLIGPPNAPALVDLRTDEVFAADPSLVPGAIRRLAPLHDVPRSLTAAEAAGATKVVAFDAVPEENPSAAEVNYCSDAPLATKDYAAARDAIVHHIDNLVRESLRDKQ